MEYFNQGQSDIFKLEIDGSARNSFIEMSRWTKFLAILGFVMLGLMLVLGIFVGVFIAAFAENMGGQQAQAIANLGSAAPIFIVALFVVIVSVYIYPTYALYKYSTCIKTALTTDNKEQFNLAVKYLKGMFKYVGILMIIFLALYGLEIIFTIIGAAR